MTSSETRSVTGQRVKKAAGSFVRQLDLRLAGIGSAGLIYEAP